MKPELKHINKLRIEDFERHPVWVNCHSADYGKSWHNRVTEDVMRPHLGSTPVGTEYMYSVRCSLKFSDGSLHDGFASPSTDPDDWGMIQPRLLSKKMSPVMFWWGAFPQYEMRDNLLRATKLNLDQIFPIEVTPHPGLTSGHCSGLIQGFMIWTPESYEVIKAGQAAPRDYQ
jgi:hypothetical protein